MTVIEVDTETRSRLDLKKVGAYRYVEDPDFAILLTGWSVDGGPIEHAEFDEVYDLVSLFLEADEIWAHNAAFDRLVLGTLDKRLAEPDRWHCTMVAAAEAGLPQKLELLAPALGAEEKNSAGTRLINLFSKPNRKGGWNDAETHPEQWQEFVDYLRQDVATLADVRARLPKIRKAERRLWLVDQRINDRGVLLDTETVPLAIAADAANKVDAIAELKELTGLANPNSVQQLGGWLGMRSLAADLVEAELSQPIVPKHRRRALELRQVIAETAVRKYDAARLQVCADGRARGQFRFFGAHTGRWAGRGIQLQNLPREHFDSRAERDAVLLDLQLGLGATPRELKALIRPMLLGPLTVVDFAQIEARVIAWLAGEQWVLDAFAEGRDIYVETAQAMGERFTRQQGKTAVLACLAEGTPILTLRGEVPIQDVRTDDLLWDGLEWVAHDGVVCNGKRVTLSYGGLEATPDHLVWVEGQSQPVPFGDAAISGARLQCTGVDREALRLAGGHLPREALAEGLAEPVRSNTLRRLRPRTVDKLVQPDSWGLERVSALHTPEADPQTVGSKAHSSSAKVHQSERYELVALRRPGNRIPVRFSDRGGFVGTGEPRPDEAWVRTGPDRQQRPLRAWEPPLGDPSAEREQPRADTARGVSAGGLALFRKPHASVGRFGVEPESDFRPRASSRPGEAEELAGDRRETHVYDILNAGPRHRFTAAGRLVHNCGFGGSVGALLRMGATGTDEQLMPIVEGYRRANPSIVRLWYGLWDVFLRGGQYGRLNVRVNGHDRHLVLPSGRSIVYRSVRRYDGDWWFHGGRGRTKLWHGIIAENVTQAVARDLLAGALIRVEVEGLPIVLHVHDEIGIEGVHDVDRIIKIMCDVPAWADGLPVGAEGAVLDRYQK